MRLSDFGCCSLQPIFRSTIETYKAWQDASVSGLCIRLALMRAPSTVEVLLGHAIVKSDVPGTPRAMDRLERPGLQQSVAATVAVFTSPMSIRGMRLF